MADELTPEELAHIDNWVAIGNSTDRADLVEAEAGLAKMYKEAGLEAPKLTLLVSSPTSLRLVARCLTQPQAALSLTPALVPQLPAEAVQSAIEALTAIEAAEPGCLGKAVLDPAQLTPRNGSSISVVGGQSESWLSAFERLEVVTGEKQKEVEGMIQVSKAAGQLLLLKDVAVVADRPSILREDDSGRLHAEEGPAIGWLDGTGDYYWHGVRVPARVILQPETYAREEILSAQNTERVRALGERLGWGRFLEIVGAETIDTWIDPATGLSYELLELPRLHAQRDDAAVGTPRLLRKQSPVLRDGTQPTYVERVHATLTSAQAARKAQYLIGLLDAGASASDIDKVIQHCNVNPALTYREET
jgi:hypothetical protein